MHLLNMELVLLGHFFVGILFSRSLQRFRQDSIMQTASEDNQCTTNVTQYGDQISILV